MGSDPMQAVVALLILIISIHAPAWGATEMVKNHFSGSTFQSTLPHGERPFAMSSDLRMFFYFNPRSRMGSDQTVEDWLAGESISIHAPAWGATCACLLSSTAELFQSTLPHGERLSALISRGWSADISIHAPAWGATV